ncbi:hypothetical protein Hanom_Chr07g00666781 [Helianthus anomalus]
MKDGNGLVQSNSTAAVASKLMTIRFRIDMSRLCIHHGYWGNPRLYLHHGMSFCIVNFYDSITDTYYKVEINMFLFFININQSINHTQ